MPMPIDAPDLPPPPEIAPSILLLAVGGGAAAVLPRILADWPSPPDAAAIDTDQLSLDASPLPRSFTIGHNTTRTHSTAGDPSIGRLAAESDADRIRALLAGHNVLILLACLGGGTASGAAPYVARLAREAGLLTIAFATTPFDFEGPRRADCASDALSALRTAADIVIRLPNQSLHALLPPDTPLLDAFAFVNRMLTAAIRGLWTILARQNILNLDISDLQFLVENSANECRFAYAEATGPARAQAAARSLLDGPMLDHSRQLANAGAILLSVVGDTSLTLAELAAIQTAVKDRARPGAHIMLGAAILPNWHGPLAITLLAADNAPASYLPQPAPYVPQAAAAPAIHPAAAPAPAPAVKSRHRSAKNQPAQPSLFLPDAAPDAPAPSPATPPPPPPDPDAFPSPDLLDLPAYQRHHLRFTP